MADTIKTVCAAPFWVGNTTYSLGARVNNDTGKIYECITAGTSAASGGPTGTTADITDGTAHWRYVVTADYTSLNAYEAQNLTLTAGNGAIAECYGGGADTTGVTIGGWTTVATGFITIRTPAAERHAGKWNTSKYYLSVADANGITINEEYIRLEGLQVDVSSATGTNRRTISYGAILPGNDHRIINCILRGAPNAAYSTAVLYIADADANVTVRNTVVHALTYASTNTYCININLAATVVLQNVTCYGGSRGIRFDSGTLTFTNVLVTNTAYNDFYASGATPTLTNCASEDATADDWGGTGNRINQTFAFVDAANGDFHLAANDTGAKDQGADLSATFTDDIDGTTRSGTWDIGADEYVAAGGTPQQCAGTVAGSATFSGSLTVGKRLAGTIASTATLAGLLATPKRLAGTIAGSATVSGSLLVPKRLAGTVASTSTTSGALRVAKKLAGTVQAGSTVSVSFGAVAVHLVGTIEATSSSSGSLRVNKRLSGSITASSSISGGLTVSKRLAGLVEAQSTVSAGTTVLKRLSGLAAGSATVNCSLQVGAVWIATPIIAGQPHIGTGLVVELPDTRLVVDETQTGLIMEVTA